MAEHYNIFYIFWEDKRRHSLSNADVERLEKKIKKICKEVKPPGELPPLHICDEDHKRQNPDFHKEKG